MVTTTVIHQFVLLGAMLTYSQAAPLLGAPHKLLKGVKLFSGIGTFYQVGTGSCGETATDSEMVVAMNKVQMENGNLRIISRNM
jgi:hypothetical protein